MIDLESLSLDELRKLEKDVAKAISTFVLRQRAEARAEVEAVAKRYGFTLPDLLDLAPAKIKAMATPKYRNTSNPDQTWSGRGRKPGWLVEALAAGAPLDSFRI